MTSEEEINRLILLEARLIDEWKLNAWLELFTDDAIYWLPMDEDADPKVTASVLYDDLRILRARVHQMLVEIRIAQTPRSETLHLVTNVEIDVLDNDRAAVGYNLVVLELRTGDWRQKGLGNERLFAGRCAMQLQKTNMNWKIKEKRILLMNRHQPIEGLSFIL